MCSQLIELIVKFCSKFVKHVVLLMKVGGVVPWNDGTMQIAIGRYN